jgi:hypothetical protein
VIKEISYSKNDEQNYIDNEYIEEEENNFDDDIDEFYDEDDDFDQEENR